MGTKPVKVSQLNSYIKRILQTNPILGNVSVIGEISNLKFHGSGHVYFSLKDEGGRINCFLPSGNLSKITCPLEEGMEITAIGYIYLYERGGSYSLNVRDIQPSGKGQLAERFEELKNRLAREGLFDSERKKNIPSFPYKVAVVTSETGAAVRDILKIITKKNDFADIMIYPVLVQGPLAAGEISAAIDDINENYRDTDVIIVGRGGGSTEELWAFNEEAVARSIAASDIPIISAVGHETDFTIADFAADLRAETPTAAAETAVPDTNLLREHLEDLKAELKYNLLQMAENRKKHLEVLAPQNFSRDISARIAMEEMRTENIIGKMSDVLNRRITESRNRIDVLRERIEAANPVKILNKGYSIVTDDTGRVIKNASELTVGQAVEIRMAEGIAAAMITENEKRQ